VIDAEKANYPIAFMCRLLRVPRSSFYAWTNRVETPTQARRRMLAGAITAEFEDSRRTSGCRRITAALNRAGIECSVGLVADLMRALGLAAVQPRAYKRTTLPGSATQPAPDLIDRDFTAEAPGQRLVGDITYLRTDEGWLYLATVLDLATRMVVGWQTAAHMRTALVTDALQMAIDAGHVESTRCSIPIGELNTRRPSLMYSPRRIVFAGAEDGPASAGTTRPPNHSLRP
jgi:transposase InsO family protein